MITFYKVVSEVFEVEKIYSFTIFLYDKERENRVVALKDGEPLENDTIEQWKSMEEKGAYLQVFNEDKDELLLQANIDETYLNELNSEILNSMKEQEYRNKKYGPLREQSFVLKDELAVASETNDFKNLMNRAHLEIMCFPLYLNDLVSTTTELVDKLFIRDILPVRIATFAYFLAKHNKIEDELTLSQIIVSALLKDIGLTMISPAVLSEYKELTNRDLYLKHPMLSIFVLSKTGKDFDKHVKRFILEHHEQYDGSGFPREKRDKYIDMPSYIINLSDQILSYSSGLVTGKEAKLTDVIRYFYKRSPVDGINSSFPDHLLESLGSLLKSEVS